MLTVDYERLDVREGDRLLDLGCGGGRHTFEALRRGATVVALDHSADDLQSVTEMVAAMAAAGEIKEPAEPVAHEADAHRIPYPDGYFDRVIAAEVLEHIPDDQAVIREIARVTRSGGLVAVSVPRRWPEQVCWRLSEEYHAVEGGHVRIYRASELVCSLQTAGFVLLDENHAHALHVPYWWLKCAVGVRRDTWATRAYHRVLVWDLMRQPWLTRTAESLLNPVLGKSVVLYLSKP